MNKKGETNIFTIILLVIILGGIILYYFGFISFGQPTITPSEDELPKPSENQTGTPAEVGTYQQCTIASDCNWDYTKYYNRNCTEGNWRCLESPVAGEFLCSYGCPIPENPYCGDSVCSGWESEWSCLDCNKDVPYLGKLTI